MSDVNGVFVVSDEVSAVVVSHFPEEVFCHVAEAVTLSREEKHVESLVSSDEGVYYSDGVGGMYVVVNVAVDEEKSAFEIVYKFLVGLDAVFECGVSFFGDYFLDSVVCFTPPTVVDAVVMVTSARYCYFVEVRVG